MFDEEAKYWLFFSAFPGVGPLRFKLLLEYFGSAKKAWEASREELLKINFGTKLADKLFDFKKTFDTGKYLHLIEKKKISVVTLKDRNYPPLLSKISDAPFLLYVKGEVKLLKNLANTIGVVGTRKITSYGTEITRRLTKDLVNAGLVVVSGMAYGVDTVAHTSAIEAGGNTIAVLGCGVDIIHPLSNTGLYRKIVEKYGCVVSEFPVGQYAQKGFFPARNRIISGLSRGVLVTEGAKDSGALITARYAGEQGREVFAVPGQITSEMSEGPSILLKNGAKLVTSADDILEELGIKGISGKTGNNNVTMNQWNNETIRSLNLSANEKLIMNLLTDGNLHFDDLVRKSGIDSGKLAGLITMMEMKKIIKQIDSGLYSL